MPTLYSCLLAYLLNSSVVLELWWTSIAFCPPWLIGTHLPQVRSLALAHRYRLGWVCQVSSFHVWESSVSAWILAHLYFWSNDQRTEFSFAWSYQRALEVCHIVQAKSELGTTKRRNLSHVFFLDQNFMRNKNILGKKPKSWTYPLKRGVLYGGPNANMNILKMAQQC